MRCELRVGGTTMGTGGWVSLVALLLAGCAGGTSVSDGLDDILDDFQSFAAPGLPLARDLQGAAIEVYGVTEDDNDIGEWELRADGYAQTWNAKPTTDGTAQVYSENLGRDVLRVRGEGDGLNYTKFGSWLQTSGEAGTGEVLRAGGFGVRYPDDDRVPSSGTATYAGAVEGYYVDATRTAYARLSGTVDATADFGASTVTTTMNVDSALTPPDTITGQQRIDAADRSFSGGATSTNGFVGSLGGTIIGPNAEEIAGSFALTKTTDSDAGTYVGGFGAARP